MTSDDNKISLGSHENILLSTEDQVIRAETLQALHFVQCNYSFGSNKVSDVFKQIFLIQRQLNLTNRKRQKLNMLYSSELLPLWRNRLLETVNCNHLALSLMKQIQVKWKNNMMVMSIFGPLRKKKLSASY